MVMFGWNTPRVTRTVETKEYARTRVETRNRRELSTVVAADCVVFGRRSRSVVASAQGGKA